jgi:hypothetical protein
MVLDQFKKNSDFIHHFLARAGIRSGYQRVSFYLDVYLNRTDRLDQQEETVYASVRDTMQDVCAVCGSGLRDQITS